MTRTRVQRARNLSDQIYDVLCEHIISGALRPGDRLIFEDLANEFGVSQTPVRDATIRLARDGLATETASGRLQIPPITTQYVLDVYAVRIALEGVAAALAASHVSSGALEELRQALQQARTDPSQLRPAAKLLHQRIHEASTNPILSRELRVLHTHADYILGHVFRRFGGTYRVSLDEHEEIVDALASRDSERARRVMEEHMRRTGERIVALIEEEGGGNLPHVEDGIA